jgi:hypothetical protein
MGEVVDCSYIPESCVAAYGNHLVLSTDCRLACRGWFARTLNEAMLSCQIRE